MAKKDPQISLYQKRKEIKKDYQPLKIRRFHLEYLWSFARKNKKKVISLFILLFFLVILEVLLPFLSRGYISQISSLLDRGTLWWLLGILTIGLIIYLILSFLSLKTEKSLSVYLLNDIRRAWFKKFLVKPDYKIKDDHKASLIAKLVYHLPLLQLGIENSIIGLFRWVFYTLGLIGITFFINEKLLIIVLLSIPLNFIIALIGYFIAKRYVIKETTLYSEIIRYITSSFYDLSFIQKYEFEKNSFNKLDNLLNLDAHFRIRRNLWIIYGSRIIFAGITFFAAVIYLTHTYSSYFFIGLKDPLSVVITGIIVFFLVRLFYVSLRIGLFFLPAKLGLILSIPEFFPKEIKNKFLKEFKKINFKARKVKLAPHGHYFKNINIEIEQQQKIIIYGKERGKTNLGFLLSGNGHFNNSAWMIIMDRQRYFYKNWSKKFSNSFFINPEFNTERTISEVLLKKEKEKITPFDIKKIFKIASKHKEFEFILNLNKFTATNYSLKEFGLVEKFCFQATYCLINKPKLIVVDHLYLDLNYQKIKDVLKILAQELKQSTLIIISTNKNSLINYHQKYFLDKNEIKKI